MQEKTDCLSCSKSDCFIKLCTDDWKSKINRRKTVCTYPKNQYIFKAGTPVMGAYFICQGKVKVVSEDIDGNEQTVRLAGNCHMFGHVAVKTETYPISALTMDESTICFIENAVLQEAYMENNPFTFYSMVFYARELRKLEERLKCLSLMSTEKKVIATLRYIADTFGYLDESSTIAVRLTRKEIADLAGTNIEQVSRIISSFKSKNWVQYEQKWITLLNIPALNAEIASFFPVKE